MNKAITTLLALMTGLAAWSQEVSTTSVTGVDDVYATTQQVTPSEHPDLAADDMQQIQHEPVPLSLSHTPGAWIPARYRYGGMGHLWLPLGYMGGFGWWDLHEGFNASVDMGVHVGLGKNNPWRGAAFFSNVAGLYAHQVNSRLTLAAGLYLSHYDGWGQHPYALGFFGLANYRISDRLDITGYAAHDVGALGEGRRSLWNNPANAWSPLLPGFGVPSTTVGADLGIRLSEKAKFNLGVSITREQNDYPYFIPVNTPNRRLNEAFHNHSLDW